MEESNYVVMKDFGFQSHQQGSSHTNGQMLSHVERDERKLAHFGKKQRFRVRKPLKLRIDVAKYVKRDFGLLSIVGLSCTLSKSSKQWCGG